MATEGNVIPVNVAGSSVKPGRCFFCHENGHWIRQCSKISSEQKNKISIVNFDSIVDNKESNRPLFIENMSRDSNSYSNQGRIQDVKLGGRT